MLNLNNLSKIAVLLAFFFLGCKEFIEPSIAKKNIVPLSPADGTEGSKYSQTFWWDEVEDALKYRLQVVTPDFNRPERLILDTVIERNKFNYTLDPGKYEWRVRAENGSSYTPYAKASFVIYPTSIKIQQVQLESPANNTLTNQSSILFKWLKLFGADKYRLQIDTNNFADETSLFVDKTVPNLELLIPLTKDKLYQWRVKAKNDTAESKWSAVYNLTLDRIPPAAVLLNTPLNNAMVDHPAKLNWAVTATAKKYLLYVYESSGTVAYSSKYPLTLTTNSYTFSEGIRGEKVFWEVSAVDEVGNVGARSEKRSFTIQ